ncbi:hypothetical protein D3C71_1822660 [compost metagenome]
MLPDVEQLRLSTAIPRLRQARALQQIGGLQALSEDQPGLRVFVGSAFAQLRQCGGRITPGQPFGRLQARALQFVTQALDRCAVTGFPREFPQALALGRIGKVFGR